MTKPGAMMWYPEAWLSSPRIAAMEPAARAAYFDILCSMWLAGGYLPDDDDHLRAVSRLERKDWARVREKVRACLTEEHGKLTQARLIEEYQRTETLLAQRRTAGAKGAKRRWQGDSKPMAKPLAKPSRDGGGVNGNATVLPMQTETETETGNGQQQQISEHPPAAAGTEPLSRQVLDAVRLGFPTAKAGDRWERELAAVRPDKYEAVAAEIRSSPAKRAETPVILVREAVAAVLRGAAPSERAAPPPEESEELQTVERLTELACKGDDKAVALLWEAFGATRSQRARDAAEAGLKGAGAL